MVIRYTLLTTLNRVITCHVFLSMIRMINNDVGKRSIRSSHSLRDKHKLPSSGLRGLIQPTE